eukprot:190994-Prorocentrum_minimum.AAC.2
MREGRCLLVKLTRASGGGWVAFAARTRNDEVVSPSEDDAVGRTMSRTRPKRSQLAYYSDEPTKVKRRTAEGGEKAKPAGEPVFPRCPNSWANLEIAATESTQTNTSLEHSPRTSTVVVVDKDRKLAERTVKTGDVVIVGRGSPPAATDDGGVVVVVRGAQAQSRPVGVANFGYNLCIPTIGFRPPLRTRPPLEAIKAGDVGLIGTGEDWRASGGAKPVPST